MKYRIWYSHCGDPSEIDTRFEAATDEEAKDRLRKMREDESYSYGYLWMERIDVEEKTTRIHCPEETESKLAP